MTELGCPRLSEKQELMTLSRLILQELPGLVPTPENPSRCSAYHCGLIFLPQCSSSCDTFFEVQTWSREGRLPRKAKSVLTLATT
jgi:hypothetical protein